MSKRALLTILCASSVALPSIAHSKDHRLSPSSQWIMNYADDSCQLTRSFGTGEERVVIQILRYEPGDPFDLVFVGDLIGDRRGPQDVWLQFGTAGSPRYMVAMPGKSGGISSIFLSGRLDNRDLSGVDWDTASRLSIAEYQRQFGVPPAVETAVNTVTLRIASRTIVLELGSMEKPMASLRGCTSQLVRAWGLDPDEQARLTFQPKPATGKETWLTHEDYPKEFDQKGEQAIIRYRLMVDAAGNPTDCAIQASIARVNFAQFTCNALKKRAKFRPALDANGKAVPSYEVGKVFWQTGIGDPQRAMRRQFEAWERQRRQKRSR